MPIPSGRGPLGSLIVTVESVSMPIRRRAGPSEWTPDEPATRSHSDTAIWASTRSVGKVSIVVVGVELARLGFAEGPVRLARKAVPSGRGLIPEVGR